MQPKLLRNRVDPRATPRCQHSKAERAPRFAGTGKGRQGEGEGPPKRETECELLQAVSFSKAREDADRCRAQGIRTQPRRTDSQR